MGKKSSIKYYISKKSSILRYFDEQIQIFRKVLLQQLGTTKTDIILNKVREEYKSLIPEIIVIDSEKNFLLREFKTISIALAFAKAMKKFDYSIEEIAAFIYQVQKEWYDSAIKKKNNLILTLFSMLHTFPFSIIFKFIIKKYEKRTSKEHDATRIQIRYVEGDGINFDYGIDILNCPICDFWQKHEASDILPYICLIDFFKSAISNSGLIRTMTLSEGKEKCDNRFKPGRKPQNRQETKFQNKKNG